MWSMLLPVRVNIEFHIHNSYPYLESLWYQPTLGYHYRYLAVGTVQLVPCARYSRTAIPHVATTVHRSPPSPPPLPPTPTPTPVARDLSWRIAYLAERCGVDRERLLHPRDGVRAQTLLSPPPQYLWDGPVLWVGLHRGVTLGERRWRSLPSRDVPGVGCNFCGEAGR